ncbi:MAG: alpha/beta hydrolase, partial [Myxococcales bacterium]
VAGCFNLDAFMYAPERLERYTFPDDDAAATRELVQLTAKDGVRTWALWLPADATQHPGRCRKTVLYCHGRDKHLEAFYWRVKQLRDLGYDVLLFDYRGYGMSEGTPSEEGLYADARAALAEAKRRSPAPVIYYGFSLGSAVCTQLATEQPPFALHLDAPIPGVDRFARDNSDLPLAGAQVATIQFDNLSKIDRVGAPLQVFHGDRDDYVRSAYGEELHRRARDPKRFWLVPGADHGGIPKAPGYDERIVSFFDEPAPGVTGCP